MKQSDVVQQGRSVYVDHASLRDIVSAEVKRRVVDPPNVLMITSIREIFMNANHLTTVYIAFETNSTLKSSKDN